MPQKLLSIKIPRFRPLAQLLLCFAFLAAHTLLPLWHLQQHEAEEASSFKACSESYQNGFAGHLHQAPKPVESCQLCAILAQLLQSLGNGSQAYCLFAACVVAFVFLLQAVPRFTFLHTALTRGPPSSFLN